MNYFIRTFGWFLFYLGTVFVFAGLVAVTGFIHIQIDAVGISLDRTAEHVAWIVSWLVLVTSGMLLIALTNPRVESRSV